MLKVEKTSNYLQGIYQLQKQLLSHYINIEGMPKYPVDVNTKPNQKLLKDFADRCIEELAEAHVAHLDISNIMEANTYFFDGITSSQEKDLCNKVMAFNEELADSLHFMVELLIYANIQPEDILRYVTKSNNDLGFMIEFDNEDILGTIGAFAGYKLQLEIESHTGLSAKVNIWDLFGGWVDDEHPYLQAGLAYSKMLVDETVPMLWSITLFLKMAGNCLKNKAWKQTEVETDTGLYQQRLVEAFIRLVGYYYYVGLNSESIYKLYEKKNLENYNRIINKY